MDYKSVEKHLHEATLSRIVRETAGLRLAASVRQDGKKTRVGAHAKFGVGELLQNRNTKEDGLVLRVYQLTEHGEMMYEVAVPVRPNTWASRHLVSDWAESALQLSDNAMLRSSENPPELAQ